MLFLFKRYCSSKNSDKVICTKFNYWIVLTCQMYSFYLMLDKRCCSSKGSDKVINRHGSRHLQGILDILALLLWFIFVIVLLGVLHYACVGSPLIIDLSTVVVGLLNKLVILGVWEFKCKVSKQMFEGKMSYIEVSGYIWIRL